MENIVIYYMFMFLVKVVVFAFVWISTQPEMGVVTFFAGGGCCWFSFMVRPHRKEFTSIFALRQQQGTYL
ncbi:hypothetical protein [Rheinheimera texasensis]|uniref:hypothetical protein n=1 Tax=Rheinheimera texasensis TaxID=306205 RepID=UPI0004E15B38|nr:hypothetical protein [Rheinheimera texasensis]